MKRIYYPLIFTAIAALILLNFWFALATAHDNEISAACTRVTGQIHAGISINPNDWRICQTRVW